MASPKKDSRPGKAEWQAWLDRLVHSRKAIVVEGKNDKSALMSVGIEEGRIFTLNKRALFRQAELIAERHDEVIILTDLDAEGRKLYSKLKENFSRNGIKVDRFFREFLFNTDISHIEGLNTYLGRILFHKV